MIIKDSNDEFARYAHLDSINVREGQSITEGSTIGVMGNTGTTNRHLHVSMYSGGTTSFNRLDADIDPENYIRDGTWPTNTLIS